MEHLNSRKSNSIELCLPVFERYASEVPEIRIVLVAIPQNGTKHIYIQESSSHNSYSMYVLTALCNLNNSNCISQIELDKPYTLVPLLGSIFLERIGSELH